MQVHGAILMFELKYSANYKELQKRSVKHGKKEVKTCQTCAERSIQQKLISKLCLNQRTLIGQLGASHIESVMIVGS